MRNERLTKQNRPSFYFGEVKGANLLHLQGVWRDILGIDGKANVLTEYYYNDIRTIATIDCVSNDFSMHIIRFTKQPISKFSLNVINFTAYVYLRDTGVQLDYGVMYAINPQRPQNYERKVLSITPESLADTEQKLYNLTDRYKMLFMEPTI